MVERGVQQCQLQIVSFFQPKAARRGRPKGSKSSRRSRKALPKRTPPQQSLQSPPTQPRISRQGQQQLDWSTGEAAEKLTKALSDWEKKEGDCNPKTSPRSW